MTETSEIGPRRRGVAAGTFLIWITLAAVGGAIVWGIYGNDVRSILKLPPAGVPAHWVSTQTNQNQSMMINADEIVGLVKDLQVSQQRTADDVRTALQLLTSEQAAAPAERKSAPRPAIANPEQDQPEPAPVGPTSIRPEGR